MDDETSVERIPLRHVVAATDFFAAAGAGVARARDVARLHRAQLHMVMGSGARRVAQHAPCPVLTVQGRS